MSKSSATEPLRAPRPRLARAKRIAWSVLGALALAWLVRVLFFSVYRVVSSSMEPTLHGPYVDASGRAHDGEIVLVRLRRGWRPRRFDLVVHERADQAEPIVKRVAGLPGESVQIVDGDLVIDGARLPLEAARPAWIPLLDSRAQPLEQSFEFEPAPKGPWTREGDAWRLDARAASADDDAVLMRLHNDLRDVHRRDDGSLSEGAEQVGDGALELEFRVDECAAGGGLRFRHVEAGDALEAFVAPDLGSGRARVVLQRRAAASAAAPSVLAERDVELAPRAWHRVHFENRDNHVLLELDGVLAASAGYASNAAPIDARAAGNRAIGPRVAFGGAGLSASFRDVRVLRDLHYLARGEHAIGKALTLGPDEYFVLGDDSAHSFDSRSFGPLRAAEIAGEPVAVLWPPSGWRWLRATDPH